MKKPLFFIVILIIIVSCGEKNRKPPVDLNRGKNKTVELTESINSITDNSIDPVRYYPQERTGNEWKEANNPIYEIKHTKNFYCDFLNDFCKKYYSRKFKGTTYIYGSISVERVTKEDENTVEVKGYHSFKGLIMSFDQKEFVATIRDYGNNKYNVLFRRRGWVTGQWKDTGNILFSYNPDE